MSYKVTDKEHMLLHPSNIVPTAYTDGLVPRNVDRFGFRGGLRFGGPVHSPSSLTNRRNVDIDVAESGGFHKLIMDPGDVFDINLSCSDTSSDPHHYGITVVIENLLGSGGAINWSPNIDWTGGYPYLEDDEHVVVAITTPNSGGQFYGAQAYPKYDYPYFIPPPPNPWYGNMWGYTTPFIGRETSVEAPVDFFTPTSTYTSGWAPYGGSGEHIALYGYNGNGVNSRSNIRFVAPNTGGRVGVDFPMGSVRGDWEYNISNLIRSDPSFNSGLDHIRFQTTADSFQTTQVYIKGIYDYKRNRFLNAAEMAP